MTDEIKEQLTNDVKQWGLSSITKSDAGVEEILGMNDTALANLDQAKIKEYLIVLTKYNLFLQYQLNGAVVQAIRAKAAFSDRMKELIYQYRDEASSVKEKEGLALSNNPDLRELQKKFELAEARETLLTDMPKRVEKFIDHLRMVNRDKLYEEKQTAQD